jgi:hypothetical protein
MDTIEARIAELQQAGSTSHVTVSASRSDQDAGQTTARRPRR